MTIWSIHAPGPIPSIASLGDVPYLDLPADGILTGHRLTTNLGKALGHRLCSTPSLVEWRVDGVFNDIPIFETREKRADQEARLLAVGEFLNALKANLLRMRLGLARRLALEA